MHCHDWVLGALAESQVNYCHSPREQLRRGPASMQRLRASQVQYGRYS